MIRMRLDLALAGGVEAHLVFTDRGQEGSGGSSRSPYQWANLASHVGDDPAAVVANRSALAGALAVPAERIAFMHPDHGRGVAVLDSGTGLQPGAEIQAVDALVTATAGVALVALAADCVPVLLVDPHAAVVAAVHSGWRGVSLDVVGGAVERMGQMGARPDRLQAFLGPAICGGCYAVPADRADAVGAVCPQAVGRAADGQPSVDLRAGIAARLRGMGASVELVGGCTAEDPRSYSYRRSGTTGRQAGAIVMLRTAP